MLLETWKVYIPDISNMSSISDNLPPTQECGTNKHTHTSPTESSGAAHGS